MVDGRKVSASSISFDPKTLSLLADALEQAWRTVKSSGNQLARPGYANVMREVMAKHIFTLAERGERNAITLREKAVDFFTANYKA
jgi:Mn-dependent DtxR family transcriptional regulator